MTIDFQGLLNVLHAAENEPNFKMLNWVRHTSCGTTHCMIGAFCSQNPDDKLKLRFRGPLGKEGEPDFDFYIQPEFDELDKSSAIAARFGITIREAEWLFTGIVKLFADDWQPAILLTKPEALARLRKFIYYKLHKQEMEYETARKVSGRKSAVLAGMA